MIYYVLDHGAVGDGLHNDTSGIQAAVDACHNAGGGRVVLSKDHIFRSGTIILKSNVDFHIEEGATLLASDIINDFNAFSDIDHSTQEISVPTYENCDYQGCPSLFFLYAKDETNITVSGKGIIDGNEEIFYGTITPYHIDGSFYPRVPLMFFEHIDNLTIKDVTLQRSAFWTIHPIGCSNINISNIVINNNLKLANCDGIDPDHCKNVTISNCNITSADDCIVFKNTNYGSAYGACENITVNNCKLISTSAAIKIGTESEDDFRNILIRNCIINKSNRGISLQLRDSGNIENIHFENINIDCRLFSQQHWWGDGEPIAITAVKRNKTTKIGHIRNVSFDNISCVSENGILIYGDSSKNISDVSIKGLKMKIVEKTGEKRNSKDLRPCEETPTVPAKPSCFYSCNTERITVDSFELDINNDLAELFKPYVVTHDCSITDMNLKMKGGEE